VEQAFSVVPAPHLRPHDQESAAARRLRAASFDIAGGRSARFDEPAFIGDDDCLRAVAQAEFGEDAANVRLDGRFAEYEPLGDLGVGQSTGDELEDLDFAVGELGELPMSGGAVTITLPDGSIAAQGIDAAAATDALAIVGGTGRYDGARGTLTATEGGGTIELHLALAG